MSKDGPEAVLLTGVYGAGKSSVAVEIADLLEQRRLGYAVLDLDFLTWFDTGRPDGPTEAQVLTANLAAVMRTYVGIGIERFLVAATLRDAAERDAVAAALGVPIRVVRLTAPIAEIERRLRSDVTSGRSADLREARNQLSRMDGVGIEDVTVANDRPIREVAAEILAWLGW